MKIWFIDILIGLLLLSTLIMSSITLILSMLGLNSTIPPITSLPAWLAIGLIHHKHKKEK